MRSLPDDAERPGRADGTDEDSPGARRSAASTDGLPAWLRPVADVAARVTPADFRGALPPDGGGRSSAVLLLFGEDADGRPEILLIERAHTLRSHAGQPAFPGGAIDPDDDGPVAAALRETVEETGLDPLGVEVFGTLPALYLPPSGYVVTPVLGWWHTPSPVRVVDPEEVASVHRVPLDSLLSAANRLRVRHPSGFVGPAFAVAGLVVWGFTGGVLDRLITLAGWERPWDRNRVEDLPVHLVNLSRAGVRADAQRNPRADTHSAGTNEPQAPQASTGREQGETS
ncbi:CoA pyrophosphatase [Actinopolymorpha sp. B9G3]|uniref:NUDIX hydrolase n=1 Tax=Actinopolymorpha sp. B9G3 TaxID=3158970 RepID=UPI0032D95B7F